MWRRTRPRTRTISRVLVTLASTIGLVTTSAVHAGAAGTATPRNFASEPGHQIIATALAAASAMGSVTASSSTTISGQDYSLVTVSSATAGQQILRVGAAKTLVRVVDGTVYINDTDTAIQAQFGVSAPKYANRWIEIPPGSSHFAQFNTFILLPSLMSEVAPAGALTTTKMTTVDKTSVVGVTGRPNIHLGLASGSETLYVAANAPHVPVRLVASDVVQGKREVFVISFAHWGQRVSIRRPTPSTPIAATSLPK
ncbi:MAG: hypothetical protein KGQ78_09740 [Acidobacteria bacterium]|nr:hypothetical protein [Acidobacteriota bacterium]